MPLFFLEPNTLSTAFLLDLRCVVRSGVTQSKSILICQAMLTKSTVDLRSLASADEGEEEPIHYEFDRKFLFRLVSVSVFCLAEN